MTKVRPPRHPTPPPLRLHPHASTPHLPWHRRMRLRDADPRAVHRARVAPAVGRHRRRLSRALRPQAAERGAACSPMPTACCPMPTACCPMPTACSPMPTACSPMPTACSPMPTACSLCLRPAAPCLMACSPANSSPHPHVCLALTLYLAFTSPRPQVRVAEKTPLQLLHFLERMVGTEPLRVAAAEELKVCLAAEHFVYRWLALARGGGGGCGEPVLSPCARLVAGGR